MIVDCHTHISRADGDIAESEHLSAEQTVDKCIVLAGCAQQGNTNKKLSDYINKYAEKMVGFGLVDPAKDDISTKTLNSLKEKLALSGIVLYCAEDGFHPAHSRAMRLYESAQKLGFPVFFHNGGILSPTAVLDYAQPYLLDEIARTFAELKIVIGNMGTPFIDQTLSIIKKHQNVYADLTIQPGNIWQVYNTVVTANEFGVMDKLLFGSGFPFGSAGQCIETLLGFNKLLGDTNLPAVPRGSIQKIIERNTLAILGVE